MANSKITWNDKVSLVTDPTIAEINKVTDSNMNEIKNVVNENADQLIISDTEPTSNDNEIWIEPNGTLPYVNSEISNNYGNAQNLGYSQEYINGKTLGTSLYSNASGTHEAFTLSEDIKHFREIEVTFGRSSWTNMKQKVRVVPQASGTTPIGLIAMYPTTDGNSLVLASAVFEIGSGGTNAGFPRNTSGTIGSTGFVKDTASYVNVYEVVGYK